MLQSKQFCKKPVFFNCAAKIGGFFQIGALRKVFDAIRQDCFAWHTVE